MTSSQMQALADLIDCISQFAKGLEDQMNQVSRNITVFHTKVSELQKKHEKERANIKISKAEIIKQKADKKLQKKKTKTGLIKAQIVEEEDFAQICDGIHVVDIDKGQSNEPNQQCRYEGSDHFTFSLPGDFGFEEDFQDQEQELWNHFFEFEADRIKKSDPQATIEEILKFTQSKWNSMSEEEKKSWKDKSQKVSTAIHKPIRSESIHSILNSERTKHTRFSNFISKKQNKGAQRQPDPATINPPEEQAKLAKVEKTVSVEDLLSEIKKQRLRKQEEQKQISTDKFDRLFQ